MANTSLLCCFAMQSLGEAFSSTGTPTISTTVFRSGTASLRCNPSSNSASVRFEIRTAGGTLSSFCQSLSFYIRIDALPSSTANIATNGTTGACFILNLNTDGTLTIALGTGSGLGSSTLAFTADSLFHRVDIDCGASTRTVYVDGVQWLQTTGNPAAAAQTTLDVGILLSVTSADFYFSDIRADSGSIGAPALGANNQVICLLPTAGNNAGSWTDGAGGTGDIHGSVDNVPPIGAAAATAAAKIKNAASGTALDYVATMQSYSVGGIPAGSIINAIQAICNDGEEITTGTKSGGIWCASNPAQSAVVVGAGVGFDYGDDVGALGTFPTGWATHVGIVAVAPSVTLSTAPTVTVRKGSSTTRVADVDFIGLYVDYTPPSTRRWLLSKH